MSSSISIVDSGSTGVLVEGVGKLPTPVWKTPRGQNPKSSLYKILTDKQIFDTDRENSMILSELDPKQQYFVYPTNGFVFGGNPDLLQSIRTDKLGKKFDVSSRQIFIEKVPHGGIVLDKFQGSIPAKHVFQMIKNLTHGLHELHERGFVHGDIHEKNVLVYKNSGGEHIARFIDFANMKPAQSPDTFMREIKKFFNVIIRIINFANDDKQATKMQHSMSGVAPVSVYDLMNRAGISAPKRSAVLSGRVSKSAARSTKLSSVNKSPRKTTKPPKSYLSTQQTHHI